MAGRGGVFASYGDQGVVVFAVCRYNAAIR